MFEKINEIPKAILIVNSLKETPLDEQSDKSFPDQMLKYSMQREHCLITTLQLLGLSYKVVENPELKQSLIESLFSTVGKYEKFSDWQEFIDAKELK